MRKLLIIIFTFTSTPLFANSLLSEVPSLAYKCEKDSSHCEEALQAIEELKDSLNDRSLIEKLENLDNSIKDNQNIKENANELLKESLKIKR